MFYYRAWVAELEGRFSLQNWALVGFFGGLALLTKYSAVIQIATLATHFLWARRWNNSKAWVGLLLSAGIATLLFLPHLMWVLDQAASGMGPLKYAQTSVEGAGNFLEQLDQLIIGFLLTQVYRLDIDKFYNIRNQQTPQLKEFLYNRLHALNHSCSAVYHI